MRSDRKGIGMLINNYRITNDNDFNYPKKN